MAKKKSTTHATKRQMAKKAASAGDQWVPKKITSKKRVIEREDEGPRGWFLEQVECSYLRLGVSEAVEVVAARRPVRGREVFKSAMRPGSGEESLASASLSVWLDRLQEYKRRKAAARVTSAIPAPGAPAVPGGRNWISLGPTVVLNGQTVGEESVGGRISGIAVAPEGATIYAASACGGVFRSDDAATSWRSLMDGFDVDPTNFASSSLACGAIAIDPSDPERVYVGTGEGDTHQMFQSRIVNALPAYRGIGPIRSDDGGGKWVVEETNVGSPSLAGEAFFALAVDPANRENVVGATTAGLYQRVATPTGGFVWQQRRGNVHCSVVVARSGAATRFFAAEWGGGVFHSADGINWTAAGTGFPATGFGRIALGVAPDNPDRVYAFVINSNGGVLGVYRLDGVSSAWKRIANPPDVIPSSNGGGQGDYDVAIAVDPLNPNLIYLGGSYANISPYPGSVWRCEVKPTPSGFKFANTNSIGTHAHADVHVLVHSPGNAHELWCGCDGGVFLNRNPRATGEFAGLNTGLACLCSNFIAQHPTDPAILLTGLQDNGTAHTSGSAMWSHVNYGDGGYCLINWAEPNRVLSFVNGNVYRSTTGGMTHNDWTLVWDFGWATMTQPIISPPYNPASMADAKWVAVGAGEMVFVSKDFASSWPMTISLPSGSGAAYALAFASTSRLYIGTTKGRVFQADRAVNTWTLTRIDNVAAGAIGLTGLVSDVAVDWNDATGSSVYVCFGGMGDQRHVWRFDGSLWQSRSGSGNTSLLDVEHNAIVVDREAPDNVYVGADIGVWHSSDRGTTWKPLQNGLPDSPVFDLQIHATQRLLRAATHGRGVYELALT